MVEMIDAAFRDGLQDKILLIKKGVSDDEVKYLVRKNTARINKLDLRTASISRLKSVDFLLIVDTQWDQMALANEVAPGL